MSKILYITNPSNMEELMQVVYDAGAMGYKKVVVHGKEFKRWYGVKKKTFHTHPQEAPLIYKEM